MKAIEFSAELQKRLGLSKKETDRLINETVEVITDQLQKNNVVNLYNLGYLEVKKRNERLMVNPVTGKRSLVPPKLIVGFKASTPLKEKIKELS